MSCAGADGGEWFRGGSLGAAEPAFQLNGERIGGEPREPEKRVAGAVIEESIGDAEAARANPGGTVRGKKLEHRVAESARQSCFFAGVDRARRAGPLENVPVVERFRESAVA